MLDCCGSFARQRKGGKKIFDSQVKSCTAILALRVFISLRALLAISVLGDVSPVASRVVRCVHVEGFAHISTATQRQSQIERNSER